MRKILIAGFGIALLAATVVAQENGSVDEGTLLTLDQAVAIALEKNLQIAASRLGYDAAKYEAYRAITAWLPRADFYATYYRLDPDTVDRANAGVDELRKLYEQFGLTAKVRDVSTADNYSANLAVVQPIVNGGAEIANILAARAGEREKRAAWRDLVLQTVRAVKDAYYGAVQARDLWRTATEAKALAAETRRLFAARERLGEVAPPDLLRWDAELAKAEGAEIGAENAYELAALSLANLLGADLGTRFRLEGGARPEDVPVFDAWAREADLDEDQAATLAALRDHPAALRMRAAIDAATGGQALAWSNVLPKLNFSWVYAWATNDTFALDGDKTWTATFQLQVPLWRSGGGVLGILEANKQRRQAAVARDDMERGLTQRALAAKRSIRSALARVRAADKGITAAQENLKVVKTKAAIGQATNLELLDAQLAYLTARSTFTTAIADAQTARAEWEYLHAKGDGK
jgi:outer membrane protein TolC